MRCAENSVQLQLEKRIFLVSFHLDGRVPEWLKGTGCKPVGYAYLGSNPSAPTICLCSSGVEHFLGKEEAIGSNPITGSILKPGVFGPVFYMAA